MDYDKDYERISKPILYIVSELWDQSTKGKYGFKVQSEILLKHDEKSMPVVVGWYKKDPIFGTMMSLYYLLNLTSLVLVQMASFLLTGCVYLH